MIKSYIKKIIKKKRLTGACKSYCNLYKEIIKQNNFKLSRIDSDVEKWLEKWNRYGIKINSLPYQIFSKYVGDDMNIIPLEICAGIVEPILTPEIYVAYYTDKNSFDIIYNDFLRPKTLLRNINGIYYDEYYSPVTDIDNIIKYNINNFDKVILKPTKEASGRGVQLFEKKSSFKYTNKTGDILEKNFLDKNYKNNFILQTAIKQSQFSSIFNESSLNTLRVVTYRSIKTGKINVINCIMRIGAKGNCIDNAHGGGMFVGVDSNGKLGKFVCNWLGETKTIFNNIDFEHNDYFVPNFEEICKFAVNVSEKIIHHNLIALDIALNEENKPVLIESNLGGFSAWLFQFTNGSAFGEYTDEIMEYCYNKYLLLRPVTIIK